MSALKEFANFITLNVANLAATYDRLLTENDENCQTLPADGRIVFARKLIKTVAEACETETSDPLRRLFEERVNQNLHGPRISGLPHPLVEVECLGQTLTPVVTNLEAGKFLWQTLAETRAVILRNISDVSSSILSPPVAGEEDVLFSNAGSKQTEVALQPSNQEQHQRRIAESLREVTILLTSSLDRETVLTKIMEQLKQVVNYDSGAVFLQEGDDLVLASGSGVDDAYLGHRVPLSSRFPEARVFKQKQPYLIKDVRFDPNWEVWSEDQPMRAWMGAPLLVGHEAIGILTADSFEIGAFGEEEAQLLQTFANQVAAAVEIARLFDEEQHQRRIAESLYQEIQQEKQLLRTLIDNLPDYVYAKDAASKFTLLNTATAHLLGASTVDEVIGKTDFDFFPFELAGQFQADEQALMQSGQPLLNHEEQLVDATTGQTRWNLTSKIPLRDSQGNVIGLIGINRDITKRKRAEQTVMESQQRLSSLVQQSPLAIIEWNTAFEVADWNPAAERIFGYTREEALGRHAAGLLVPEEVRPIVDQIWQELLAQKGGTRSTNDNFTKEGRLITCDWYNTPLVGVEGQVIGVASLVDDITERKRAEQTVQESSDRRSRQIQAITNVAQQISGTHSLNDLFQQVVDLMQSQFGYYHAQVYTMVEADMVLQAGTGEIGRRLKERDHKIPLSAEQSLVIRAVWEGESVLVPDVSQEPTWLPNPLLPETKAELAVPITLGAEILGVLDVQGDKLDSLNEEDRLLLTGLCGQIAIAIETRRAEAERAQLLTEVERRARREQTIREITEKMRTASSLEGLVKTTAEELGRRFSAKFALVELGTIEASEHSQQASNGHAHG